VDAWRFFYDHISELPKPEPKFVIEMLETMLTQANG